MAVISAKEWHTLEPLLDAILDAGPAERAACLDAASAHDPARRSRLEELLAACDSGEKLLLTPVDTFAPLLRVPEEVGGRYRIVRELGHGGMATVYLADDPKHRRQVAVKILDLEVNHTLGDSRFLQEIEIAAGLQHPHILSLFDSGEVDGLRYYVMPYVEGETLRDQLVREKQLPVEDAVRISREVADALDFAHRHGVVHRDIKPENILLHEGRAMVADFGIALAVRAASVGRKAEAGVLIGTPHYMSPEQGSGAAVTGRSDVYSLGVVLYEMLVGAPPHTGRTAAEVLAKIGGAVPTVTELRKAVPPNVAAAVARAIEPLPADRFGTARDFSRALADAAFRHGAVGATAPSAWNRLTVSFAAIAVVAAVGAAIALRRSPEPRPVTRVDVTPGTGRAMLPGVPGVEFALSRDGLHLVYVGESAGSGRQLWMRALNELHATPIPGTNGATSPALSADGRMLAFNDRRTINTIPVAGGTALRVVTKGDTPAWGTDGSLYFADEHVIHRLLPNAPSAIAFTTPSDGDHSFPTALPDGRGLLLTVRRGPPGESRIAVVGPKGGRIREILTGTQAHYLSSGHIVWATARGTVMAAPFDLKQLAVTGPTVPLVEGVKIKLGSASQLALSPDGTLLYQAEASARKELVWVNRAGGVEPVDSSWTGNFSSPELSPDGSRIAVLVRSTQTADIWIRPLNHGPSVKLSLDGPIVGAPTWTPDGKSITYAWDSAGTNGDWTIRTRRVDGGTLPSPVSARTLPGADPQWSPDGKWLVFRRGFMSNSEILAFRPGSDTAPLPLLDAAFGEGNASISRDGRWLAFTSSETGRDEVFVRPFPNTRAAKWVVSTGGGAEPVWSRSGRELFYRNGQRQMVAVSVETVPTFAVGTSRVLFTESGLLSSVLHAQYDVAPDDQRFLMIRQQRGDESGALILVLNLFEGLRRSAPR